MYKKNIEKTVIDDGFAPFLVEGAEFEGCFEFPVIKRFRQSGNSFENDSI